MAYAGRCGCQELLRVLSSLKLWFTNFGGSLTKSEHQLFLNIKLIRPSKNWMIILVKGYHSNYTLQIGHIEDRERSTQLSKTDREQTQFSRIEEIDKSCVMTLQK